MSAATFAAWKKDLERRAAKFNRPKIERKPIVEADHLILWCNCCGDGANFTLVRLSLTEGLTSIHYGVCSRCRDTERSERVIYAEMRKAWRNGKRDVPEEFGRLCDEATRQYAVSRGDGWLT